MGIAGAVAVAVLAVLSVPRQSSTVSTVMHDPALAATSIAASKIEHMLPGQRVALLVQDTQRGEEGRITVSLTWALTPGGFHAEVTKTQLARELGSSYVFRGRAMPLVTVLVRDQHVTVHVTRSSEPARVAPAGQLQRRPRLALQAPDAGRGLYRGSGPARPAAALM